MLNKEVKYTHYFVDEYGLMVTNSVGHRDCLGDTFEAAWTYEDLIFHQGALNCFSQTRKQLFRHPMYKGDIVNDCSRDHVSYYNMLMKVYGEDVSDQFEWWLSDVHTARGLYLYLKRKYFLYYLLYVPFYFAISFWNKFLMWAGEMGEDITQEELLKSTYQRTKKDRFVNSLLFPIYAIYNTSWQVFLLKDCWAKKAIQKSLLKMAPKYNFFIRLLNGGFVEYQDIIGYKPMTGSPQSTCNNRHVGSRVHKLIPEEKLEFNNLQKDMLLKLWDYNIKHSDKKFSWYLATHKPF